MNKTSLFSRIGSMWVLRIFVAIVTTAMALAVGHFVGPLCGDHVPYIVALVAVSFCAWYYGLVPAALASGLATAVLKYWFMPPVQTFMFASTGQFFGLLMFVAACALMIAMAELHRRKSERLRIAQEELEKRVQER